MTRWRSPAASGVNVAVVRRSGPLAQRLLIRGALRHRRLPFLGQVVRADGADLDLHARHAEEPSGPCRLIFGLTVAVLSGRHPGQHPFEGLDLEPLVGEVLLIKDPGHLAIDSGLLYVVATALYRLKVAPPLRPLRQQADQASA